MNSLTFLMRALTCAGTIALGSLPIALVGDMNDVQMGTSISVAAGMMSGCSVVLAIESLLASSCIAVVAGIVFGVLLIHGVQWMLAGREDLTFGDLKGSSALGAIVIFLSMLLHSLGEGLSIGVSASEPETSSHSTRLNTVVWYLWVFTTYPRVWPSAWLTEARECQSGVLHYAPSCPIFPSLCLR